MKTQECVLPVRCASCGTTFDLWYDLLAKEDGRNPELVAEIAVEAGADERLCWECRKAARRQESEKENYEGIEDGESEDFSLYWE